MPLEAVLRHARVRFQGAEYWLHDGLLSPLDHFDERGELLANPFRDVSYAYISDGLEIYRFRSVIGTMDEVEFYPYSVKPATPEPPASTESATARDPK